MPRTDDLEATLRSRFEATDRYLHDDGFTARTMQRLPRPARWRARILGAAFALSLLTAALLVGDLTALLTHLVRAGAALAATQTAGLPPMTALVLPIALVLALAFLRDETS